MKSSQQAALSNADRPAKVFDMQILSVLRSQKSECLANHAIQIAVIPAKGRACDNAAGNNRA
jgi:hypothetical protein